MKSSFTASRVQPWKMKRGRKPERGKKLFAFSMSPIDEYVLPGDNTLSRMKIVSFSSKREDSG